MQQYLGRQATDRVRRLGGDFDVLKKQEPFKLERFVKGLDKLPALPWDEENG